MIVGGEYNIFFFGQHESRQQIPTLRLVNSAQILPDYGGFDYDFV